MQHQRTNRGSPDSAKHVAVTSVLVRSELDHELHNPLAAIRALSEIVRDNPGMAPEQRQKFLHEVVEESKRLMHRIDTLLRED